MKDFLKYTLARLGLLLGVLLILLPIPQLDLFAALLIAFVVSLALSWFLLRNLRNQASRGLEEAVKRRREKKEKLRAALAGEEEPPAPGPRGREGIDKA